jgi:hypothetical protein
MVAMSKMIVNLSVAGGYCYFHCFQICKIKHTAKLCNRFNFRKFAYAHTSPFW